MQIPAGEDKDSQRHERHGGFEQVHAERRGLLRFRRLAFIHFRRLHLGAGAQDPEDYRGDPRVHQQQWQHAGHERLGFNGGGLGDRAELRRSRVQQLAADRAAEQ